MLWYYKPSVIASSYKHTVSILCFRAKNRFTFLPSWDLLNVPRAAANLEPPALLCRWLAFAVTAASSAGRLGAPIYLSGSAVLCGAVCVALKKRESDEREGEAAPRGGLG